jgi:hypothetical protein
MMDGMVRTLRRSYPRASLRVWTGGRSPSGEETDPAVVIAEWTGQCGHPSSYVLLGATPRGDTTTFSVDRDGAPYPDALAGVADTVRFGLPDEYRSAVEEGFALKMRCADVVLAAHGRAGSSPMAFQIMATFIASLADLDPSSCSDDALWQAWDDSRRIVRGTGP